MMNENVRLENKAQQIIDSQDFQENMHTERKAAEKRYFNKVENDVLQFQWEMPRFESLHAIRDKLMYVLIGKQCDIFFKDGKHLLDVMLRTFDEETIIVSTEVEFSPGSCMFSSRDFAIAKSEIKMIVQSLPKHMYVNE